MNSGDHILNIVGRKTAARFPLDLLALKSPKALSKKCDRDLPTFQAGLKCFSRRRAAVALVRCKTIINDFVLVRPIPNGCSGQAF